VVNEVADAYRAYQQPFRHSGDRQTKTPAATNAAALGRGCAGATNLIFPPLTGLIKGSGLANDIRSATGLSNDAAANAAMTAGGGIKLGAAGAVERAGARAVGKLNPVRDATRKLMAPGTVDDNARAAATMHRMSIGTRRAEAESQFHALEDHQRVVGNASLQDQHDLARFIDTRGRAVPLRNSKLQPAADAIRDIAKRYRTWIENALSDDGGSSEFKEDYYPRL